MHKRIPVAELTLDDDSAAIVKVGKLFAPEHLPIGVGMMNGKPNKGTLAEWWLGRSIPASRSGLREALEILNVSYTQKLLTKCYGLSLSDQYWINPKDEPLEWDKINFFENPFSDDVGNALFGRAPERTAPDDEKPALNLMSPDNTSDGWLRKKWTIIDGRRCLIKGGSDLFRQEPLNEVLATAICHRLGIPHVPYTVIWDGDEPFSVCPDFIDTSTELVSAWHIMQTRKKENSVSTFGHYINCCRELGVPGIEASLDAMLTLDYIIANEDRHQNNFGVVRNAETLEWIGPAPIFDSGTSMWYSRRAISHQPKQNPSKPFRSTHAEQIKLVGSFERLDFTALAGVAEEYAELLTVSPFIDEGRRTALCRAVNTRIEMVQTLTPERTQ
jgi:hypothetical protein